MARCAVSADCQRDCTVNNKKHVEPASPGQYYHTPLSNPANEKTIKKKMISHQKAEIRETHKPNSVCAHCAESLILVPVLCVSVLLPSYSSPTIYPTWIFPMSLSTFPEILSPISRLMSLGMGWTAGASARLHNSTTSEDTPAAAIRGSTIS